MESRFDETLLRLVKAVAHLEETINKLPQVKVNEQITRFELLLTQLNRHVNPNREEVALLKRTNRELARELQRLSAELGRYIR